MKTIAYTLATLATIAFVAPAGAKTVVIKRSHDHGYHHWHHWHHNRDKKIVIKKHGD